MKINRGKQFRKQRIVLDDTQNFDCTFEECEMVFGASGPVGLSGCKLLECSWTFVDAAALTLGLMRALYPNVPAMLEATFDQIRGNVSAPGLIQ